MINMTLFLPLDMKKTVEVKMIHLITFIGNYIFTFLGKIFFKLEITDILYTFVMARTSCAKKLD